MFSQWSPEQSAKGVFGKCNPATGASGRLSAKDVLGPPQDHPGSMFHRQAVRNPARNDPGSAAQPKVIWEEPPGGARTLELLRSVMKFPTFWPAGRW